MQKIVAGVHTCMQKLVDGVHTYRGCAFQFHKNSSHYIKITLVEIPCMVTFVCNHLLL